MLKKDDFKNTKHFFSLKLITTKSKSNLVIILHTHIVIKTFYKLCLLVYSCTLFNLLLINKVTILQVI